MDLHALSAASYRAGFLRLLEQSRSDRVLSDPFVEHLVDHNSELLHEPMDEIAGVTSRSMDDFLRARASTSDQVVILGAGKDSRSFRLNLFQKLPFFEVDSEEALKDREERLSEYPRTTPTVAVPLGPGSDLVHDLTVAGFDATRRTLWIAEGVFRQLTPHDAAELFGTISELSARGSHLVFDVANVRYAERYLRQDCYGTDVPNAMLLEHRWVASEIVDHREIARRYERGACGNPRETVWIVKASRW
jgi:methyltransferase (TIGR00027 family)